MNHQPPVANATYLLWRLLIAVFVVATAASIFSAQQTPADEPGDETVSPLFQQALPNVEGETFTSVTVEFPPGGRAAPHRHGGAFVYAYVLAGTVRSKLDDEPIRTYGEGESWFEAPGAHHVLTENASTTARAKLLVTFVSGTGDALKVND